MSEESYFSPDRFRSALQEFVVEVWDNRNQAAKEAGIAKSDLYDTIEGKRGKLLKAWQINALLNCARFEKGLSEERYNYWYQVLHRELIFIKTLSAWLYSETDKRIEDPALIKAAEEHNQELKKNLARDFPFLENVTDTVFKAGGFTWSFSTLYLIVRKSKRTGEIFVPPDWQSWVLDTYDAVLTLDWPDWDTIVTVAPGRVRSFVSRLTARIIEK